LALESAVGPPVPLDDLVARIATRTASRSEADLQADLATLLRYGGLNLDDDSIVRREVPTADGTRRRIDIERGLTVFELKKDLRVGRERESGLEQLAGYVQTRSDQLEQRYVGVLTDGAEWYLASLESDGALHVVSEHHMEPVGPDVQALIGWLEAVLATQAGIKPTPVEIEQRLGARSPGFGLDLASLRAVYEAHADDPQVQLARELWGRLLTAALGTSFEETDELFIEHTYLVVVAELIAHAVVGIELADPSHSGRALLSGEAFRQAQIGGVVEPDFFDWPAATRDGDRFVRTLARRLARFEWSEVEHDVLKTLYESVIDAETRHRLGEYYTPDWLAERMVADAVEEPLTQTVLDPACGSGTFLFWAIRRFLVAAEAKGLSSADAVDQVVRHVFGVDLHPVAVTLARVTYLLAIGRQRLADRRAFAVPVYLGDSVQWNHDETLLAAGGITVHTTDGAELFARQLHFPESVVADAGSFDRLVAELAERAAARGRGSRPLPPIAAILNRHGVEEDDRPAVETTFRQLCALHDDGRNHVWGYYVRNLARPLWFSRNRVDTLVGNPPWLSYRFMPGEIQQTFRTLSTERGLWAGAEVATHQDLSGLFVARACELYLRPGGRFSFVMPAAALSRRQFKGFRTADYAAPAAHTKLRFDGPLNLTAIKPTIFPVPSAVVHGRRAGTGESASPMPAMGEVWSGRLPDHRRPWAQAAGQIAVAEGAASVAEDAPGSPYEARFLNGATIYPRVLFFVERAPAGPLGVPVGLRRVRSHRSALEKAPWRHLQSLEEAVEERFIFPVHLGSTIAPYRSLDPVEAIVPWVGERLLDDRDAALDDFPGLASWWHRAVSLWELHRSERSTLSLREQLDYQKKLTTQFPASSERIVYTKAGNRLAAARVTEAALIENKLYWAPVASPDEGRYLCAILNSQALGARVAPLQSVGQFGRRDFDKYVFAIPFPIFDPAEALHAEIARAAAEAEDAAASVALPNGVGFQHARRLIRAALDDTGATERVETPVARLLDSAPAT